ncbi:MAG: GNAT family N-acetyltransferase [Bacteroidetes bacterium]|nr:GNAT family N-acetyltransferase [Bacteroidota bacterium]
MKQPIIETERLIIREILTEDAEGMFELDSNPNVHLYLGNKPVTTLEQSLTMVAEIRQQYIDNGICRWAVVEKESGKFVGWTGFRLNSDIIMNGMENVFDLGYRFVESAWGKGYASETAFACMDYAFKHLSYDPIYGAADIKNIASNKILQKVGMRFTNEFDFDGEPHNFYSITKEEWNNMRT